MINPVLELNSDFDNQRELYILKQDEEYDRLKFDILLTKCVVVPLAMFDGFLIAGIFGCF